MEPVPVPVPGAARGGGGGRGRRRVRPQVGAGSGGRGCPCAGGSGGACPCVRVPGQQGSGGSRGLGAPGVCVCLSHLSPQPPPLGAGGITAPPKPALILMTPPEGTAGHRSARCPVSPPRAQDGSVPAGGAGRVPVSPPRAQPPSGQGHVPGHAALCRLSAPPCPQISHLDKNLLPNSVLHFPQCRFRSSPSRKREFGEEGKGHGCPRPRP